MQVNVQYASEHLEELLASADHGEDIEIAREGQPLAKLIIMPTPPPTRAAGKRILGAGEGLLRVPTDEEWRQMKDEDAHLMNDAPLMTTGDL